MQWIPDWPSCFTIYAFYFQFILNTCPRVVLLKKLDNFSCLLLNSAVVTQSKAHVFIVASRPCIIWPLFAHCVHLLLLFSLLQPCWPATFFLEHWASPASGPLLLPFLCPENGSLLFLFSFGCHLLSNYLWHLPRTLLMVIPQSRISKQECDPNYQHRLFLLPRWDLCHIKRVIAEVTSLSCFVHHSHPVTRLPIFSFLPYLVHWIHALIFLDYAPCPSALGPCLSVLVMYI